MKVLISIVFLTCFFSQMAYGELFNICDTIVKNSEISIEQSMRVFRNADGTFSGKIEVLKDGSVEFPHIQKEYFLIRPDLMKSIDSEDLNFGELFILHTKKLEGLGMRSGIDLKRVRQIEIYFFEQTEEITLDSTSFADAKDENGKTLGEFMSGFLLAPCR